MEYIFPHEEAESILAGEESPAEAILIARSKGGDKVVLKAFSGASAGDYELKGFVPPCFSLNSAREILSEFERPLQCYTDRLEAGEDGLAATVSALNAECRARLLSLYTLFTPTGRRALSELGAEGTSAEVLDSAVIKLFSSCFRRGLEPLSLASRSGNPFTEETLGLLHRMIGLELVYADDDIAVIIKPEGMLSVPGRGDDKLDSAATRIRSLFPSSPSVPTVHRLDMDTSGVMVYARSERARREIGMQFENRQTEKQYIALLEGELEEAGGIIDAPMRLDVEHRPYQIIDYKQGKRAVTEWRKLSVERLDGRSYTRVLFHPLTGRTHQLRVHSASILGHPIKGDRLYGSRDEGERLALHAASLTFTHPASGERLTFTAPAPF